MKHPPQITFMSLQTAHRFCIEVGQADNVAMTTPGRVVFVADRPWDEQCTDAARAAVDWHGDSLMLPPFDWSKL